MRAEQHIPLFLWVTAAIVMHAVGGGGATEVVRRIEETLNIRDFAADVRRQAQSAGSPFEVTLLSEEPSSEEDAAAPTDPVDEDQADESTDEKVEDSQVSRQDAPEKTETKVPTPPEVAEQTPREEPKKEEAEKKAAPPQPEPEKDPVPELQVAAKPPPMQPQRRVAVDQHVEDKNQEDNPDAEFLGEHANRVAEQTRASITSTDSNADAATLGGPSKGSGAEPGNSDQTKVAQSDESPGAKDRPAGEAGDAERDEARAATPAHSAASAGISSPQAPQSAVAARTGQEAREALEKSEARDAMPETLTSPNGSVSAARAEQARKAQMAQRKKKNS